MAIANDRNKTGDVERRARSAYRALKALQGVGGLHWSTILGFVTLAVLVSLIATGIDELVKSGVGYLFKTIAVLVGMPSPPQTATPGATWWDATRTGLIILAFVGVVVGLVRLARRRLGELQPKVLVREPSAAVAVIIFLSTPNMFKLKGCWKTIDPKATTAPEDRDRMMFLRFLRAVRQHVCLVPYADGASLAAEGKITGDVRKMSFAVREPISDAIITKALISAFFVDFNWRMNVEALRFHAFSGAPLREVIVVPSADTRGSSGSIHWLPEMKAFLHDMIQQQGCSGVAVKGCGEFTDARGHRLPEAINYEDVRSLIKVLYDITSTIKRDYSCRERDMLIDITSGKALCSAAGLAFATLVEERRVQYVDTESLEVETFDVTHEVDLRNE